MSNPNGAVLVEECASKVHTRTAGGCQRLKAEVMVAVAAA
jgi:hypothetical protein